MRFIVPIAKMTIELCEQNVFENQNNNLSVATGVRILFSVSDPDPHKDIVVFTNKRSQAKVSTVFLSYWKRVYKY